METLSIGSSGPNVKRVQSLLKKLGYYPGNIDGVFGIATEDAVRSYQNNNGLDADGIVGEDTWKSLDFYLRGYDTYAIRSGDTIYSLANKYGTTVNAILTANPGIDPNYLMVSQEIIIPYGISIVPTDIDYTYDIMKSNILSLKTIYPFLEIGIIGKSVLGNNLYYIRLGRGPKEVFYNGAHHSLEWITSVLLMKFVENYCKSYSEGLPLRGFDINNLWNSSSIYIVPMVNPDGVNLVLEGLQQSNPYYNDLLYWNDTGLPFSQVWQANIRGVDLNRNYPASWEEGKAQEQAFGVDGPGPTRYGGPYPLSEPETLAVAEFTRGHDFNLVIAYHTQGQVIFWRYLGFNPPMAREIGEKFAALTGYILSEVYPEAAYAGYKDWFIETYNRPGYTFEVGTGENPLPIDQFDMIYNNNIDALLTAPTVN